MVFIFLLYIVLAIVRPQEYVDALEDLDLLQIGRSTRLTSSHR